MTKMDVDGTMGIHFEEDIITEILSRLPVKSLFRFKCVIRSWMTLISKPYFVMKHHNHSKNNQNSQKISSYRKTFLLLPIGSWRKVDKHTAGIYPVWRSTMDSPAFLHDAFHWVCSLKKSVVSFNISNEVYTELLMPDVRLVISDSNIIIYGISVLGGMLCVYSIHAHKDKYNFNLWVMKDYGVEESWIKLFNIPSTDLRPISPKYWFSDGEVLLHCIHLVHKHSVFKTSKEASGFWSQSDSQRFVNGLKMLTVDTSLVWRSYSYPHTSSWNMSRDCCSWDGVVCDDMTDHFIETQNMMMVPSKISFLLQFFTLLYLFTVTFASTEETTALFKWKATFKNQNNSLLASWTPSSDSCSDWYGVICINGRVNTLNITNASIIGTLYAFPFSSLPFLEYLNLSRNNLFGTIPPEIGYLTNLVYLDLHINHISGSIPPQIGSLAKLQIIRLFDNHLTGPIPETIGYLRSLTKLSLSINSLTGSIPASLGNLTNLSFLFLHVNHLSGSIPEEIGYLRFPKTNNTTHELEQESDSTFLSELNWKVVLMGYNPYLKAKEAARLSKALQKMKLEEICEAFRGND
ncbi:hypothetical protein H5410_063817 [Solanum commersonii]|uniref:Leucine-rich repeat-containing N-terminal plant-type domain-containing protein n=1 Tax=Solanum commersonii TaxID=4109 RepID=A0A9J5WE88_SOLCO|nr:hypothetical protein H5410_063817 [Solanum commersonii]